MLDWKAFTLLILAVTSSVSASEAILFMHGFAGWGPDDGLNLVLPYFGMLQGSLQEKFNGLGYITIATTTGPVSSVWDRVCEAYAEIVGTQVDYGGAHSAKYGHLRQPSTRNYTGKGLYPSWGPNNKIHIIAHSMGGQDARVLASLLNHGDAAEIAHAAANGYTVSPLFAGGNDWIASVSTISTPHDGTSLAPFLLDNIPFIKTLIVGIVDLLDVALPVTTLLYNFELDQWGISPQQSGESFTQYLDRIVSSPLWQSTNDLSPYDLSPEGAMAINQNYSLLSHIPYFSYQTDGTFSAFYTAGHEIPDLTTLVVLWPTETILGAYTCDTSGLVVIDSSWFKNDGIVNSRSQQGPTLGTTNTIVSYNSNNIVYGSFNFVATWSGYDHFEIVGLNPLLSINSLFTGIISLVTSLPVTTVVVSNSPSTSTSSTSAPVSVPASAAPSSAVAPDSATPSCDTMMNGFNQTCGTQALYATNDASCTAIQTNMQQCFAQTTTTQPSTTDPIVGVIVGSVVGGVVVLAAIAGLIVAFYILPRRRSNLLKSGSSSSVKSMINNKNPMLSSSGDPASTYV